MKEDVLRRFLEGGLDAAALREDLAGSSAPAEGPVVRTRVEPMDGSLRLAPAHLIRLCDAVLEGGLPPELLEDAAFALADSERFSLPEDGDAAERIGCVLGDWVDPELFWPLTPANVRKWREYLETGRYPFGEEDAPREERSPERAAEALRRVRTRDTGGGAGS